MALVSIRFSSRNCDRLKLASVPFLRGFGRARNIRIGDVPGWQTFPDNNSDLPCLIVSPYAAGLYETGAASL